ncbi:hypothetical protein [Ruminiclostridium cellulolyticum]|uniref:Uncharacterized protein n=1 Tax=Ruminiclostridium cellulolyticum (strain ATCC 35319 / DSM 5812 / JCM 6584 / H10) TaxID=394503 RepID=B8I1Y2_RUMCH|nr:hypothetical protein [Ruminiclostridium cellulolyticum]ACL75808.1 hypothetical protein Ccel_1454 [Ruminiclostridium cellulolyticum H10]
MNRFIMITNKQKLLILAISLMFIIISAVGITMLEFPKVPIKDNSPKPENLSASQSENKRLKEILSSIVPADNKILYEDDFRKTSVSKNSSAFDGVKAANVQNSGNSLLYTTIYCDEDYLRPIYVNSWKQAYYRGWLYLPRKIIYARHNLFTYSGNSANIFDIEGELGFYPNISMDNENNINFLIYNFDLENAIKYNNRIVFYGKPVRKGVQIVAIKKEDLDNYNESNGTIGVQLCTPAGYELDYQNVVLGKNEGATEDYGLDDDTIQTNIKNNSDLAGQNTQLRQELTHYISDSSQEIYFQQNGGYQTSDVLDTNVDLEEAFNCSKPVAHKVLYNNLKYKSPVYHPGWKKNYDIEWCYIPRKIYLNMKEIFVLPSDSDVVNDLYGELGFFEKSPVISKKNTGLFIKNFSVDSVHLYENNIIVTGIPCRNGVQIISIPKAGLPKKADIAVRLVTKDLCEIDADVLKN